MLNDDRIEECEFDAVPSEADAKLGYILQFGRLSYLSPVLLLACDQPDFLGMLIEQSDPFPVVSWVGELPHACISRFNANAMQQYVLLRLVDIAERSKDVPAAQIFPPAVLQPFSSLIELRPTSDQDLAVRSRVYAPFLSSEQRGVRIGAYTLITLMNAEQPVQKVSELGKGLRPSKPRFKLPDDQGVADLLLKAILVDSETPMSTSYIEYLATSKVGGDRLSELVRRRPLLVSCLQNQTLAGRLPLQSTQYDIAQPLNYRYPEYPSLKGAKKPQPPNYHVVPKPIPPTFEIADLPSDDDSDLCFDVRRPLDFQFPTFSKVDVEVYRCEIALSFSERDSPIRFFAVAALKNLISADAEAFLRFAEPTLEIVGSELKHNNLIDRHMLHNVLCFLIICRYRYRSVNRGLSTEEVAFFRDALPRAFEDLDQDQFEGEPLVTGLYTSLLHSNVVDGDLTNAIIPPDLSFDELIAHSHKWPMLRDSILILDREYSEGWLAKVALRIASFKRSNFTDAVILPLLLSCGGDSVSLFLTTLKRIDPEAAVELRRTIERTVSAVYITSGFPLTQPVLT
jgi:hypothetical protein